MIYQTYNMKKILKEQDSNRSGALISNILQKMQTFNEYVEGGGEVDERYHTFAFNVINSYRKYNTEEAKQFVRDNQIPARDIVTDFATSLNKAFPEKYESDFAPIFQNANITPKAIEALPTTPEAETAPETTTTPTPEKEAQGTTGQPATTVSKTKEAPKIKFAGTDQAAYVDMGGGKYVPANEDQLADPNTQLYVKNPKKGQGESLKPNYVKVRREGNELRRQSQFGGALGSVSNLFGDIGNTLAGKK